MQYLGQIKNKMKIKRSIVIYILACAVYIFMILCKKNYHVDEIYTFGLSNFHGDSITIDIEDGLKYSPAESIYVEYMSVHPDKRFDYKNVWVNQKRDVHPPLYYVLVHTICSVVPGRVSVWFPGGINILFMLFTLYFFRKLLLYLGADDLIVLYASIFFVFNAALLSILTFMRMYVMTMFFVTWITYLLLQMVSGQVESVGKWLLICCVTVMGALTHYYFIVYLVLLCMVIGISFVFNKRWKALLQLSVLMMLSAAIAICIFPGMIDHIFMGYRGQESIENLKQSNFTDYVENIMFYFNILNDTLMGGMLGYLLLTTVILVAAEIYFLKSKKNTIENAQRIRLNLMAGITVLLYFSMISKVVVYQSQRYISPVYAVTIVICMVTLANMVKLLEITEKKRRVLLSLVVAITLIAGWKYCKWEYLYTKSESMLKTIEKHENLDCVYIYNENWRVQRSYQEIKKLKSVTFYREENYTDVLESDIMNQNEIIVYIMDNCNADSILNSIVKGSANFDNYKKLGGYGYSKTFLVYGEK